MQELTAIHATGYRHRDIKPEQVIVDGYDGQVLTGTIVDWACGRHRSQGMPPLHPSMQPAAHAQACCWHVSVVWPAASQE